ncbi:XTP/dITP diphosphatase [Salirhabdus salicampi]|uniref:XTP/dITP diphosphatase n=1 Tax=Salirhabdus salicampi TaxID=476102 RepID=UPI0020C1EF31|nr:XTP/dITP diphosphatase [Salirhabdus salicampi]MCP8617041.1 XTP/dITP diphosphatase [Salirhabdus salicampi]
MKKILLATKNEGKAKEFKEIFGSIGYQVITLLDLEGDVPDVEETGETFEANAALKAETFANRLQMPVMADDSGLEVDALQKRPGVYSARYAGLEKNDQKNLEKVLQELEGVEHKNRTARFVCVLAFARPEEETIFARGTCEGYIASYPQGTGGFGYDPIFIPNGYNRTLAQFAPSEKHSISHRGDAIEKMLTKLKTELE